MTADRRFRSWAVILGALQFVTSCRNEPAPRHTVEMQPMGTACGTNLQAILPGPEEEVLAAEVSNIDQLIEDMLEEISSLDSTAKPLVDPAAELRQWKADRSRHCSRQGDKAERPDRGAVYLQCMKWMGTCELERLLARYDSLSSAASHLPAAPRGS